VNQLGHTSKALGMLLEVVEAAIRMGDWEVDGRCDPDGAIRYAKFVLGFAQEENDE
jgi:hypothetical protein